MEPVTYKLKEPFECKGQQYESLTFKPLKGKHIKFLGQDPKLADVLKIAAKVSGVPDFVFDDMAAKDCIAIGELIGDFLTDGREIGG